MEITLSSYARELFSCLDSVRATGPKGELKPDGAMESAARTVLKQCSKGRKVILIGNGGSASIANHIAVDLWKNGGVRATSFSDSSLLTCISNDYGYPFSFEKPVSMFADKGDVLVAISSSGKSENIINGVTAGRAAGCKVITMSGFGDDNPLRGMGDINFFVPSGSYGFVEVTHLALCHCITDIVIARNN